MKTLNNQIFPCSPAVYFIRGVDGVVKYIGSTCNLSRRIRRHEKLAGIDSATVNVWFMEMESREKAISMERRMIHRIKPVGNLKGKGSLGKTGSAIYLTNEDHRSVKTEALKRDCTIQACIQQILQEWRNDLKSGRKLPAQPRKKGRNEQLHGINGIQVNSCDYRSWGYLLCLQGGMGSHGLRAVHGDDNFQGVSNRSIVIRIRGWKERRMCLLLFTGEIRPY